MLYPAPTLDRSKLQYRRLCYGIVNLSTTKQIHCPEQHVHWPQTSVLPRTTWGQSFVTLCKLCIMSNAGSHHVKGPCSTKSYIAEPTSKYNLFTTNMYICSQPHLSLDFMKTNEIAIHLKYYYLTCNSQKSYLVCIYSPFSAFSCQMQVYKKKHSLNSPLFTEILSPKSLR